jgi:serine kinase of HPr protein (carbohydrate metabolism regulator)
MERVNVHATGLVLEGTGLMLRGPSGSGKSLLALMLLDLWEDRGLSARLVADDRLDLGVEAGALVMHAPPAIAGLVELRGRGLVRRPFVPRARVDLVVDLIERHDRMPEEGELGCEVMGIPLARCPLPRMGLIGSAHQIVLLREALRAVKPGREPVMRQKTT